MRAYLFWHLPYPDVNKKEYETSICEFQSRLAGAEIPGVLGCASFRVPGVPWLGGRDGYEDWVLLSDCAAMDTLNARATVGELQSPHERVASRMGDGHGGIYELISGTPMFDSNSSVLWLTRPRGIQWRPMMESVCEKSSGISCWRRQMVLGPGSEFAIVIKDDQILEPFDGWTVTRLPRSRVAGRMVLPEQLEGASNRGGVA